MPFTASRRRGVGMPRTAPSSASCPSFGRAPGSSSGDSPSIARVAHPSVRCGSRMARPSSSTNGTAATSWSSPSRPATLCRAEASREAMSTPRRLGTTASSWGSVRLCSTAVACCGRRFRARSGVIRGSTASNSGGARSWSGRTGVPDGAASLITCMSLAEDDRGVLLESGVPVYLLVADVLMREGVRGDAAAAAYRADPTAATPPLTSAEILRSTPGVLEVGGSGGRDVDVAPRDGVATSEDPTDPPGV
mmetsp:Transcript_13781/g.43597  ORF Transcript_13781/g.43597 Transcript_13781/m.43597 type:complete len:250 (-) Transcript_13781:2591-3340(-)